MYRKGNIYNSKTKRYYLAILLQFKYTIPTSIQKYMQSPKLFRRDAALYGGVVTIPWAAVALPTLPKATILTPPMRFIMPPRGTPTLAYFLYCSYCFQLAILTQNFC
jgi:hypothetical protein